MIHFKDSKNKSALSTRWAQMSKQEQIIERKKMEIQAKLEAQKQATALAAQAKLSNPKAKDEKGSNNIFSNDGSFMSQFKALLEKQKQDKKEKEEKEKEKNNEDERKADKIAKIKEECSRDDKDYDEGQSFHDDDRRRPIDRGQRDKRRWSDRGRNRTHSPMTPVIEDRKQLVENKSIIPLMQIPIRPPDDQNSETSHSEWNRQGGPSSDDESDNGRNLMGPGPMAPGVIGPGPMGPGPMGPGPMGPGPMGPGPLGPGPMGPGPMGPGPMGPGAMGPGPMGPGPMGHGPMGPGPMGPGMGPGPMGPGPMGPMGSGPMGPGSIMGPGPNMRSGPNMGPSSNMGPGPNMGGSPNMGPGPMMGPGGPNMPPMPPFMRPPNFPMPPNFMGPNGPGGPCGPGPMPPNMCGPNMPGPGPNGPPFFGPPFPNPSLMGPNGPPNSMMPPNSMNNNGRSFMGPRPPFGPNGSNFGPNGNGPPNVPFMPPKSIAQNSVPLPTIPEPKALDTVNIPPPEPLKLQNIPPPMSLPLNIPKPNDIDLGNIPVPPNTSQVLSADTFPPSVQRAASEVACNGDHWENVLKAIHSQDQTMWFLHNTNSNEYKAFRELVIEMRNEGPMDTKQEVKPEDKYEPEFCLEDDESSESRHMNDEKRDNFLNWDQHGVKREQTSSQSDEEPDSKRERRRKKKSRWGEDPPAADIKPPGLMAPLPTALPTGPKLAKIDEDGLKLTNVNRNNQALMQYAVTNYGTTNLSPEDWKKCEDNFKLNLLYQDMLKKRQEVERLAAAGKHKYEYDSDEDTSEGTWEHRLRAREMNATERWATELTKQAAGKHHIGDFLPPEELKKFMEKYSAFKSGKEPDLSDYKEFKLKEDNVGFKMLQKLGWSEGQGLGAEGTGIVEPVNKANQPVANLGLGASASDIVSPQDDEFDAYRKRMMLAYRFRPNPLNNPRRPYY
ncbi:histone-lysine N-methyltransferase SETD1B-like [Achroia grisella]|uniref:histone-lysine N-methyltransferase SETD1B-like n=1 Tax=Achroia grisella TaxID=688607 RepID=UPI0027D2A8AA|nr:histone-lysine N-methyltransferase SETD1B-like [Achroia grisella]